MSDPLLTTPQAAARLGLAVSTLEKDRCSGILGLRFIRVGRAIRYDPRDIDAFVESRRRSSTSEPEPGR
jgi:predicted DNA-binding transcriptional regulator AlpA